MDSQQENLSPPADRPSFFSLPPNFFLWARLGPTFWGGVLFGVGLGLFIAAWLAELGLQKSVWLGFLAIIMVGGGLGVAIRAARRNLQWEKDQPKNQ
jgi:high-affinity Fe2+/Pb2+ permease